MASALSTVGVISKQSEFVSPCFSVISEKRCMQYEASLATSCNFTTSVFTLYSLFVLLFTQQVSFYLPASLYLLVLVLYCICNYLLIIHLFAFFLSAVLDMARHVPLYRALLELLRAISTCTSLVPLLLPLSGDPGRDQEEEDEQSEGHTSVGMLLAKMKTCVDTYTNRLR